MSKLMLIDATHPEETRVAVVSNGQIEDFDFEAKAKRQLRGNIYLAKITRVEPSLQAAFVDYGGNRHGFLAFSEIHPDYYQIPKEDRDALMAEAAEEEARRSPPSSRSGGDGEEDDDDDDDGGQGRNSVFHRKYKIQEVIRRRQVMLVQVVKEERGNKGAALTTYLSLAGRYCVLMPNTARGGGISRKITNAADRKRLKSITSEFEVPRGAGLIVRTAGAKRTKIEIRRDFEYLTKLWQQIVGKTMESMAPALIHEEGHLVLRAVRDLYDKDVEQIVVEGAEAWNEAKTFVKMLMPAHARKVVQHQGSPPLFVSTGVEDQLENIFSPVVQLPSGGYIVINQTEALVAIDVNSGKATRERNVEATALKTNMEAASEACRQMRLRDLAGLIVIDFIDMEESKNNRAIEKRMKDSLKIDRARVQTGRISQFGLFEISRQRRRAGVLELSSEPCGHCAGTGRMRSVESAALQLLRTIEARAADDRVDTVHVEAPPEVALYILNEKRGTIATIENTCHVNVRIEANATYKAGEFGIEGRADGQAVAYRPLQPIDLVKMRPLPPPEDGDEIEEDDEELELEESDEAEASDDREADDADHDDEDGETEARGDDDNANRKRSRRGGRRRRGGQRDGAGSGLEIVEPEDDTQAQPQQARERNDRDRNDAKTDRGDREDGRRGRRRRGGRSDRNADRTPRTPDIATDGGEMLDAIASAPFLAPAAEAPEPGPEIASTPATPERAAVLIEDMRGEEHVPAFLDAAATSQADPAVSDVVNAPEKGGADHEIAASAPEPAPKPELYASARQVSAEPEPAPEPSPVTQQTGEPETEEARQARLHPIHGTPVAPTPPEPTQRKIGWWNRRKTG